MKKIKRPKFECHLKIQKNESFKKNFGGNFLFRGFKKLCLLKFLMKKTFWQFLMSTLKGPCCKLGSVVKRKRKYPVRFPARMTHFCGSPKSWEKNIPSIISCVWAASVHTHGQAHSCSATPLPPSLFPLYRIPCLSFLLPHYPSVSLFPFSLMMNSNGNVREEGGSSLQFIFQKRDWHFTFLKKRLAKLAVYVLKKIG